jgi:eukaryotic-like serine/threonine-protein kinase
MFRFLLNRALWVNILAGFVVMSACLYLLYLLLGPLTKHGKSKTVPHVLGKSFDDAKRLLNSQGFEIEIQDSIYVDTSARGSVLKQVPEGDAVVKINRVVYLTINRFVPPLVEMPNLIGFSFRNAELQLENMGLRVGDTTFKPDFAKNSILEQSYNGAPVTPGTKVQQGSKISLVLGDGVGDLEFAVPNLVGMTFKQAKILLESNGLSFLVVLPDPGVSDTLNSYVKWQSPEPLNEDGKKIKIRPGQTMDVKLSIDKPIVDTLLQNISEN